MLDCSPVSMEAHHEIEQFLYRESLILDAEKLRDWLTELVDPDIRYQMVTSDERSRKDKSPRSEREVMIFDDGYNILDLRVRQFETGLQAMLDPPQRMFRIITNVMACHGEVEGTYAVFSYGTVSRYRRQYESERAVYRRHDILKRAGDNALRLLSRRIELGERVVRNKNLLFFL